MAGAFGWHRPADGRIGTGDGGLTQVAAVGLMLVVIPITLVVQLEGLATLGPLFKNIGLLGGLLYFATHGPRSWSLDEWLERSTTDGPGSVHAAS